VSSGRTTCRSRARRPATATANASASSVLRPLRQPGTDTDTAGALDSPDAVAVHAGERLHRPIAGPVIGEPLLGQHRVVALARQVGGSDFGRRLRTLSTFLREDARSHADDGDGGMAVLGTRGATRAQRGANKEAPLTQGLGRWHATRGVS
jgi:hypothetical protein